MSEWKPIETAPKDRMVLLLVPRRKKTPLVVSASNLTGKQWWATGIGAVKSASHWADLPAPPATPGEG